MSEPRRSPGDAVVLRHARAHYRWAAPMHVVSDIGDEVALYLQPGSSIARMAQPDGSVTRDFYAATRVIETNWRLNHCLHLVRFGDEYSIQLFWREESWDFRCWYVNLQEPLRRSRLGFESMDLTLDLVIAPDLTGWEWKDEDEFERGIEFGWYTREQLKRLRGTGERVLEDATHRRPPFDQPWPEWRPDPAWKPLLLPAQWDQVPE